MAGFWKIWCKALGQKAFEDDKRADKVAIGTGSVDPNSLLKVDGNIYVGGITGSFPQNPGDAKHMLVLANRGGKGGRVEYRDISADINARSAERRVGKG